ncbi:MAG: hypothetical protein DME98_14545 [Verrucomicrobia bacterium]|nr:MAG: hypothetical protein DME98_14545 [Verrucomicrobiota bacterium]
MLVPERCAPAMQITVWLAALFFTQNPYTTTWGSVRQAGLVSAGRQRSPAAVRLRVLPARSLKSSSHKFRLHLTFTDAAN